MQVITTPGRLADLASPVRPGREHDICARHHGLIDGPHPDRCRAGHADPGRPRLRERRRRLPLPAQEARPGELTEAQQTYNKVICGIHGVCERATSQTTFKALRRVSLDPSRITKITAAALVLLQIEHDHTI
ncbi:transposase family protein [Streptomyces sp. NBC_00289]|uniref:transposase family protein n=1 Tax=Streptomyces sp. NBC_00289 TaxID=2975703 RepID=UPI00352CE165